MENLALWLKVRRNPKAVESLRMTASVKILDRVYFLIIKNRIINNPMPRIINIAVKNPGQQAHAIIKIRINKIISPNMILLLI